MADGIHLKDVPSQDPALCAEMRDIRRGLRSRILGLKLRRFGVDLRLCRIRVEVAALEFTQAVLHALKRVV
jgi:hypothetical protein